MKITKIEKIPLTKSLKFKIILYISSFIALAMVLVTFLVAILVKNHMSEQMYRVIKNDTASIEIEYEGVLSKDILNGLKSGERIKLKGKSIFKFKDDKIVSLWDYS